VKALRGGPPTSPSDPDGEARSPHVAG